MVETDRKRFFDLLLWLAKRYSVEGLPRLLPSGEDLEEYYEALRDIPIEDLEGGARWHYGHSEFFPERPAALRKSARKWREENPRPRVPANTATNYERAETPESREEAVKALQAILDSLSGKMPIPVWKVDDLVGSA